MNPSFTVEIEKIVYGGRGMGRINGKIVFVPFTAPGDIVQVEVVREGKDYAEAILKTIEQSSPLRVKPFCSLFGKCGGCHYQHISYIHQLKLKEKHVRDALLRLAQEENFEMLLPIPSPHERGYRIRAQFKGRVIEGREVLGFYGLKSHQLVEVKECPLLHPLANEILQGLQKWLRGKDREYSVRNADIQVSLDENRGVVRLRGERFITAQMAELLSKEIPKVKGIVLEGKRKISWGEPTLLYRCPKIFEKESLPIRASYDSFSQVNPYQNWNLIRQVVEWADLSGRETVLDLFCGSGNLTLPLAQRALRVWGVDKDQRAVENAGENARQNKLGNCTFIAAEGAEGIRRILQETDSINVSVLDPPRAGAKNILKPLSQLAPQKILYVSCEPPTLARDLSQLKMLGYHVRRIQPLDMFPQTYHIEVIAELIKGQK
ncbi:MAG: 23S rRNA (uracil(1939)-C(5))-methyltransferase RlmD [Deltaproteobacteria bacterium]|nr:23S rRNA (uracil(1939)-C(5))-methyltransferase RlmD [Deltaproteobacteria bacterium]